MLKGNLGNKESGQIQILSVLVITIAVVALVVAVLEGIFLLNIDNARDYLESRGYVVLAAGEYSTLYTEVHSTFLNISNETFIFPEETNATITLTAGGVANTFGDWAEIKDSNLVALSSKFVTQTGHLAEINTEDYSVAGERYMVEIAYGAAKDVVARTRIKSEAIGGAKWVYYLDLRSKAIPVGETVYYRMKAETAGATLECSFRYYYR